MDHESPLSNLGTDLSRSEDDLESKAIGRQGDGIKIDDEVAGKGGSAFLPWMERKKTHNLLFRLDHAEH